MEKEIGKKRCVTEIIYIKKRNNSLNKITDVDALPSVFTTILNKMLTRAKKLLSCFFMRCVFDIQM